MKIALMLSGQVRTFLQNWPTFERHVIRDYDVDVFCYAPNELSSRVLLDYGFRSVLIDDPPWIDDADYQAVADMPPKAWYGHEFVAQAHLRRLWGLYQVSQQRRMIEQLQGWQYDLCVRTRYDLYFTSDLEPFEEFDPAAIAIPKHDNWEGYNDRFAVGGPEVIDAYCRNFFTVDACIEANGKLHSEPNLKHHLDSLGIPIARTNVLFNTVRHGEIWRPNFHTHLGDICDGAKA